MNDLVSIIIPTYDRQEEQLNEYLINRSLKSAYAQTYENIEIIVVIDNTSSTAVKLLKKQQQVHNNLRYYSYGEKVGAATTRNYGVSKANGKWIAFLDDDDEWSNNKIESQLKFINNDEKMIVFSSMKFNDTIIPRSVYKSNIPISEYLICRRFGKHYGTIQSSSILTSKKIMESIPFKDRLKKHQDWDWIIRASKKFDIRHQPIPLSIYHVDAEGRMSNSDPWKYSKWWIESIKRDITLEAYSSFQLEYVTKGIIKDETISKKRKLLLHFNIIKRISLRSFFRISTYYLIINNSLAIIKS